ncbi:transcriptional regulator, partial [Yersinia kristensenii ATCC 33638]
MSAAERHTIFNFSKIADYYAHAPADIQALFEQSALVIID